MTPTKEPTTIAARIKMMARSQRRRRASRPGLTGTMYQSGGSESQCCMALVLTLSRTRRFRSALPGGIWYGGGSDLLIGGCGAALLHFVEESQHFGTCWHGGLRSGPGHRERCNGGSPGCARDGIKSLYKRNGKCGVEGVSCGGSVDGLHCVW